MLTHSIHTISAPSDSELALAAGLHPLLEHDSSCDNCSGKVGFHGKHFLPYVIVLSEDDTEAYLCGTCSQPVLNPWH
jgi:hypothetical protein